MHPVVGTHTATTPFSGLLPMWMVVDAVGGVGGHKHVMSWQNNYNTCSDTTEGLN